MRAAIAMLTALAVWPLVGHASGFDVCRASQVRLSIINPGNAYTGGNFYIFVDLRNVSSSECSLEGHPLVVVPPHEFPVVVGDLAEFDPRIPYVGPERLLHIKPGAVVRAEVVIGRRCDGAKSEMTTGTIAFSYLKTVRFKIPACRRNGAVIYTGPFLPTD